MIGQLPETLQVNGQDYEIRTDYRDILRIIEAFNDPELKDEEKVYICLYIMYVDMENIPPEDYKEAYKEAIWFIDLGDEPEDKPKPRVMDWEQDEKIIFPAINSTAGYEVRSCKYLHWWTFMGFFMEIKDGTFSQVMSLRMKKAKGKKFEKWEREFWQTNKKLCVLRAKLTQEEKEEKDKLAKLLEG